MKELKAMRRVMVLCVVLMGMFVGCKNNEPALSCGGKVAEAVDLGVSVKWASWNVGASSPEEFGNYYAWGETTTKGDYSWATYTYARGDFNQLTKYCSDADFGYKGYTDPTPKTILDLTDDVARVSWGRKWRMPTKAEVDELFSKCDCKWKEAGEDGYTVAGYEVSGRGNTIFLPAAGFRHSTGSGEVGSMGFYWSSTLFSYDSYHAYNLFFHSGSHDWNGDLRCEGVSVRPVRAKK